MSVLFLKTASPAPVDSTEVVLLLTLSKVLNCYVIVVS